MYKLKFLILIGLSTFFQHSFAKISRTDVLSVQNGKYMLDGKQFAEISFNKFDLFWSLWGEAVNGRALTDDNLVVQRQQKALSDLSKAGFKTIRIFGAVHDSFYKQFKTVYSNPEKRESVYYKALDKVIELLEKNHIRAVFSLGCDIFVEEESGDNLRELVNNPNSASRKSLNTYLDDIVKRYKNSNAILMWEVTNELTLEWDIQPGTLLVNGKRHPTMDESIIFYKDVIARIRKNDTLRMINNGGSMLRESVYNLSVNKKWGMDSYPQHKEIYHKVFDNSGFGVLDIHYYTNSNPGYFLKDEITGGKMTLNLPLYMKIAESVKLPLYIGEYGALPRPKTDKKYWGEGQEWFLTFGNDDLEAIRYVQRAADMLVDSGVMFTHWWCYQSDRTMDQNDPFRMDMDIERTPKLFQIVVDANKRLKEKYGVK